MDSPIPGDIDKADELFAGMCTHPAETVTVQLCLPIVVPGVMAKPLGMQSVEGRVVDQPTPGVSDRHEMRVPASYQWAYACGEEVR